MVGDGAERQALVQMRDKMGLDNVMMVDQQPKSRMREYWALSDISLVLLKKSDLFKTVIPSKIFESMAMAKPIILGVEGESADILREAKAGICIEPEDADDLAARVLELFQDPEQCRQLGGNGRQHVMVHFDRTALARKLAYVIEAVGGKTVLEAAEVDDSLNEDPVHRASCQISTASQTSGREAA
jgi:glycosyltransferase involved in cell wall biosynthesis